MIFIEKTLKSNHTKNIFLLVLLFFFARSVGERLITIAGGFSLGSLMRTLLPILLYPFLMTMIFMTDFSNLNLSPFSNVKFKQFLPVLCTALFIAPWITYAGSNITMTDNLMIVIVIAGFLISLFLSIKYDVFYGIIGFILLFPLLSFIQSELGLKNGFNLGPVVLPPAIIFMLTLSFISLLSYFIHTKMKIGMPMRKTIGIYLFVFFASVITSVNFQHSLKIYLLEIIYPLLFFFLIVTRVRTDRDVKLLLCALIVSAILFGLIDYYFIMGGAITGISELTALHGNYFLGSERELFLLLTIPLAFSLAAVTSKTMKLILIASCIIMLFFVIFSHTRIAIIAMIGSLTVFFRNRRAVTVFLLFSIMAIGFWDWTLNNIFTRFQEFNSLESMHPLKWSPMRYQAWVAAVHMIKDHPILGIGFGMWENYYYLYGPSFTYNIPGYGLARIWIASAHNAFLDVAAQAGIPGLIAWLLLIGAITKEGLYVFRKSVDKTRKTLALGCISSLVGFWIVCFGGYPSFSADRRFGAGIAFWTVVCVIFAIKRLGLEQVDVKTI